MANRFYDQYRKPHSGESVFPHENITGHGNYDNPNIKGGNYSKSTENPYMDEGGSSVPRKPKSPTKPSSGGMALPIPQKVK